MSEISVRVVDAPELGDRVILAIDTALGTSVALGAGGHITEVSSDNPRGHAEVIGTLIERVLEATGLQANLVTVVVAGMGPGPFTGLRVGISAAHAFALGRGIKISPVVSHDAVALDLLSEGATAGVSVVQDAKRRELFVTDYSGLDWADVPVRLHAPRLEPRAAFEGDVELRTETSPATNEYWPERIPAANLVRIAARKLATGGEFEPDRALYLRLPDVMQPSRPKPVSS